MARPVETSAESCMTSLDVMKPCEKFSGRTIEEEGLNYLFGIKANF